MRRTVTAAVVAAGTVLTLSATLLTPTTAAFGDPSTGTPTDPARAKAQQALQTATAVLAGDAPHVDGTTALLRLRLSMRHLPVAERRQAAEILDRPTSSPRPTDNPDPFGQDYSVPAKRKCSRHICIHWVPKTADAPPGRGWVNRSLKTMNKVWAFETRKLGYHHPISDGKRGGGSGRFDVYLKELTGQGLYGLTVAEQRTSFSRRLYSSYLLIDNDFKGYPSGRSTSLKVTAAHEFFHAIQYAYDVREDTWLKESTATWMEERYDDRGNDNRQYVPFGQLAHPSQPLDQGTGSAVYGNWLFFEYLSQHYGRGIVRKIWTRAAAFHGGGHQFSAQAIRSALRHVGGGMTSVFARYANGNTVPAHTYGEGRAYPASGAAANTTLTKATRSTGWRTYHVKHLASVNVRAVPGTDLTGKRWGLRIKVDAPGRGKAPAVAVLLQRRHHPMTRFLVHLGRTGHGKVRVPFSVRTTSRVTVTLANASTGYRCHRGTAFSCQGRSLAAHPAYKVKLTAVH
jgi:hypothetical protein